MKRFSVFAFLALGVLLISGATTPANASTCIQFSSFCDKITVNASSDGTVYGMWDWACDGVDATNILGTQHPFYMGTRPAFSDGTAYTYTFWFLFSGYRPVQGQFNMYGTDGSTEFVQQSNQPFTHTAGSCGFGGPGNGKPSLVGLH
jgi:hypothetical protein